MWLLHGTTQRRAEAIERDGPDVTYVEPGSPGPAENFSACPEGWPSALGLPEAYARGKAAAFPSEAGAALLAVDVPEDVILLACRDHLALYAGLVKFRLPAPPPTCWACWWPAAGWSNLTPAPPSTRCWPTGRTWRKKFGGYDGHVV